MREWFDWVFEKLEETAVIKPSSAGQLKYSGEEDSGDRKNKLQEILIKNHWNFSEKEFVQNNNVK